MYALRKNQHSNLGNCYYIILYIILYFIILYIVINNIFLLPGWGATWKKEGHKWQGHMVGGVIIPSRHPRHINPP